MTTCTLVRIAFRALGGLVFSKFIGTSSLSGYLVTSPGSGDAISTMTFGYEADLSLIFAVQILRALVIAFTGPSSQVFYEKLLRKKPLSIFSLASTMPR